MIFSQSSLPDPFTEESIVITGPTASDHLRKLADAVRNNELTTEARSAMVTPLLTVDAAARLAPKVREYFPDSDAIAVGYFAGNWQPVANRVRRTGCDGPSRR
jgi:hypothetical protein